MNSQEIIARLQENEPALRARGVTHAALFGSRARGDNRPNSDIDIMIEIAPDAPVGVWEYVAITQYISDLYSRARGCSQPREAKGARSASRRARGGLCFLTRLDWRCSIFATLTPPLAASPPRRARTDRAARAAPGRVRW
ncbi:MAG: nucleotidyltransferase domain-containing protein [Methylocystis sp.]